MATSSTGGTYANLHGGTWQNGGGSLMVWGAFGYQGKSELVVLEGKQSSHQYIWTVSENMLSFAHLHYGNEFVFMQDKASIHASKETKTFFKEMDATLLDWPSRSPDLNPIENVWVHLAGRVYSHGRQYNSVAQFKTAMNGLLDTMDKRCFEFAKKLGDKTHY
ncbi:Transposase [Phytophthora megakarya]|uniref:Transposase n=1 Tax=Phytophthora megakarya TaxID=4795 RepID=A0A225WGJ1_9STRA|nr:Transposase [Phytophthora megakarya]